MKHYLEVKLNNGQWCYWKGYKSEKAAHQAMNDIFDSNLMTGTYRIGSSVFEVESQRINKLLLAEEERE